MNAYRLTGTVTEDRTITVQVPEASIGAEAEIIVLFPQPPVKVAGEHPLRRFLDDLRSRPVEPGGEERAQAAQDFLRESREEWD